MLASVVLCGRNGKCPTKNRVVRVTSPLRASSKLDDDPIWMYEGTEISLFACMRFLRLCYDTGVSGVNLNG